MTASTWREEGTRGKGEDGPWIACGPEAVSGSGLKLRHAPKYREGGNPCWPSVSSIPQNNPAGSGLITALLPSCFPQEVMETIWGPGK